MESVQPLLEIFPKEAVRFPKNLADVLPPLRGKGFPSGSSRALKVSLPNRRRPVIRS